MDGLPRIGLDIMGDLADEQDVASDGERAFRLENADSDIPAARDRRPRDERGGGRRCL